MPSQKFYITTTLPYVNSDPHLGFALEMVQADAIVRCQKLLGKEVFFNTGTDEHGLKIYRKAKEDGKEIQEYVDEYAEKFKKLMPALGISTDIHFIRTTQENHIKACQKFWDLCHDNGDIYKKIYHVKYCVGCELEKAESDLNKEGKCLIHPHLEIEIIEEENYFFRFSKYQRSLLEYYEKHPDFVVPDFRFNEIKEFVKRGLADFSISRLKEKMPWGVPVPGDDDHVMYVWFDALINYVSTLGWGNPQPTTHNPQLFNDFWGTLEQPNALQIAGKDNLRQQSAMWQAMLLSAGLPPSRQIIIHGFITSGGHKMSKSQGNVADPYKILAKLKTHDLEDAQAIDALRYYLLREIPTFEDGDYTWEHFAETYNANLANGIGNLTSRILKMAVNAGIKNYELGIRNFDTKREFQHFDDYNINMVVDQVWAHIKILDKTIQDKAPYKKIKTDLEGAKKDIMELLEGLELTARLILPIMPNTSEKILEALKNPTEKNIPKLFPRIL